MEIQRFNQSFEELVALLSNSDRTLVYNAVQALGELDDNRAVEPLLDLCKQSFILSRLETVKVLSKLGDQRMIAPLWKIVTNPANNADSRRMATFPLAKINEESQALLFEGLQHPDAGVRQAVMGGLSKLGNDKAVEALTKALETETDPAVRERALTALGHCKHPQALEPIFKILENPADPNRVEAIAILGYTDNPAAIPVLAKILSADKNPINRAWAAESLIWLKFEQSTEPLLKGLLEDSSPRVRAKCIHGLWYHLSEPIVKELIFALYDKVAEVRAQAASRLGYANDRQAIKPLLEIAQNEAEKANVRQEAILSLGRLKATTASVFLLGLLTHKKSMLRAAAAEALGNLGDAEAFAPLMNALADRSPAVREKVILALALLKHPDTATIFLQRLKIERQLDLRNHLVKALGELRDKSAVEPLLKELTRNRVNKWFVIQALGDLSDSRACEAITPFLQDENTYIRLMATAALAKLGDKKAIDLLVYYLRDYSSFTRYRTIETLAELGAKAIVALPTLDWLSQHDRCEKLMGEDRITIRQAAANAMERIITSLSQN